MLEDLRANSWSLRPCCMVLAYRVAHFCSVWRKKNVLNNLWAAPLLVLYRIITEGFFGYEIRARCDHWPPFHYPSRLRRSDQ